MDAASTESRPGALLKPEFFYRGGVLLTGLHLRASSAATHLPH